MFARCAIFSTNVFLEFIPYTYHYKIAQALLHLKPSGEVEVLNHPHPVGLCIVAISLSVLLFLSSSKH